MKYSNSNSSELIRFYFFSDVANEVILTKSHNLVWLLVLMDAL